MQQIKEEKGKHFLIWAPKFAKIYRKNHKVVMLKMGATDPTFSQEVSVGFGGKMKWVKFQCEVELKKCT